MESRESTGQPPSGPMGEFFPIALVGIGCRLPGGVNNPSDFWDVIREGKDCITEIPPDRWAVDSFYDPDQTRQGKMVTRKCGFVDNFDSFDNMFFKIAPREAASLDPQQRLLLEVTWEAFEDAGIVSDRLGDSCGVFVGIGMMDHAIQLTDTSVTDAYTLTGIAHSVASNRISYVFNLKGPSYSIDTACASGLTAIHLACTSLWNKECKVAVVPSCNLISLPDITVAFSALGVLSPEGKCCPFSSSAQGYVRSEGWGAVILKPLTDAIKDGDHIYTVLKGSCIASNGRNQSLTMPSISAQEAIINGTYERFGVPMSKVKFVEAHGTGTPVGDPMEAEAIGRSFSGKRNEPLKIGSVKGNFGHTEVAAGTTSAIKVALMMKHRELVPTINFVSPNPHIDVDEWGLDILTKNEAFDDDHYIIGLNSFGFAGALAHCIFEEPPNIPHKVLPETAKCGWKFGDDDKQGQSILIPLSAKSPEALRDVAKQWIDFEEDKDAMSVVSWLSTRRTLFDCRLSVISNSGKQFRQQLREFLDTDGADGVATTTVYPTEKPKICMIFPGQGQQWGHMGRQLYQTEEVFRSSVEECDRIFQTFSGWSVLKDRGLFTDSHLQDPHYNPDSFINDIEISQPAILFMQVGLFNLWRHWGVEPDAIVGHSLGEVAAAYASGGMTLEEAVEVIYIRSVEQGKLKGTGSMAALRMNEDEAQELCYKYERLYVAAINAPGSVAIAGNTDAIIEIAKDNPTLAKQLRVQCAFHTPDMDPSEKTFKSKMEGVVQTPAGVRSYPVYSTLTGECYEGDFATDYWWENIRNKVKFQQAVESILNDVRPEIFIECAASATLLSSVNQIAKGIGSKVQITTIASGQRQQDDRTCILRSLTNLLHTGYPVDWANITRDAAEYVSLPLYPWQRIRSLTEPEYRRKRRLGLDDRTYKGQDGIITLEMFPYLNDYSIGGELTFPESGLIEYAVETCAMEGQTIALSSISFNTTVKWIQEKTGPGATKMTMNLACLQNDNEIQIIQDGNTCFTAVVEEEFGSPSGDSLGKVLRAKISCTDKRGKDDIYATLHTSGYEYGPNFQIIQEAIIGENEAFAYIDMAQENKQRIQTTQTSACFQLLQYLARSSSALFQPTKIKSLKMHVPSLPTDDSLIAYAEMIDSDSVTMLGNATLSTTDGKILVEICECEFQNTRDVSSGVGIDSCLYETKWQPSTVVLPPTSIGSDMFKPENIWKHFPEEKDAIMRAEKVYDKLKGICAAYIRHGLDTVPENERQKCDPRYLKRLEALSKDTEVTYVAFDDIEDASENILQKVPEIEQELSMVRSLGEHLPTTLRNPQSAMTRLFKPECMAAYFLNSLTTRLYYKACGELVKRAVHEALKTKSVVRILEVGARMGGLTLHILEHIKELCEEGRVEYVFTDLSVAFFPHARDHLEDYPFVKYQQLDIEKEVEGQGFVPCSFDILICLDTLHSTADLYEGMYFMRSLVADDGWFILYEATTIKFIAELIFGALRLCWIFEDLRTECCWMDQTFWADAVRQCGYSDVVALSSPNELFHSIFIGKKTGGEHAFQLPHAPIEHKESKWIIISDPVTSQFASSVAASLDGWSKKMTFKEMLDKPLLNGENGKVSNIEPIFIWNETDKKFTNLLTFLDGVQKNSERLSRAWIVTCSATSGNFRPIEAAAASIVRAATNQIQCPVLLVDIDGEITNGYTKHARRLVDVLLNGPSYDTEISIKGDGTIQVPRLLKLCLPQTETKETPYWKVAAHPKQDAQSEESGSSYGVTYFNDPPVLKDGHILIKVKAIGLNENDEKILCSNSDNPPCKLGTECSGVVVEVGNGVSEFGVGDEVFGFGQDCYAAFVVADSSFFVRKPRDMAWTDAAGISVAFTAAYHSLIERANLCRGQTALILTSCPGVREAAAQVASLVGANVICAVESNSEKDVLKKKVRVQDTIDVRSPTFSSDVLNITNGCGVNVILSSLTGKRMEKCLDLLASGGKFCDLTNGERSGASKLRLSKLRDNQSYLTCNVEALTQGGKMQKILQRVAALFEDGMLQPLEVKTAPIYQFANIFSDIINGTKVTKKMVFEVPSQLSFKTANYIPSQSLLKSTSTYLVTGSDSGLGQALTRWLCNNGAKHVALISDSQAQSPSYQRTIAYVEKNDCKTYTYTLDLSKPEVVEEVVEDLSLIRRAPPLKGVFHCAGVDGVNVSYLDLNPQTVEYILRKRVATAGNLHDATKNEQLDIFLTISSAESVWGSPADSEGGIADAFFNSLATQRKAEGMEALNIQLGHLRGLDAYERSFTDDEEVKVESRSGLHVEEFLQFLRKLLLVTEKLPSTVCLTNQAWDDVIEQCQKHHLKCRHLMTGEQVALTECSLTLEDLESRVKNKLGELLCINPESIDLRQPMINYGVDSLMSVEMVTWASREWNVVISQLDILGGITTKVLLEKALANSVVI